jgi:hypothetical protein
MEPTELFRGCERLLIVGGGIVSIIFGGLLLKWGVFVPSNFSVEGGEGNKIGKFRMSLENATPGALFALFGAIVLAIGLFMPAKSRTIQSSEGSTSTDTVEWRYSDHTSILDFLTQIENMKTIDKENLEALRIQAKTLKARISKEVKK